MVRGIRIYVEGGGDSAYGKARVSQGFGQFLHELRALAREKSIKWDIIACGSRDSTFDDFKTALTKHPDAFNVLLVDSEKSTDPRHGPWQHLSQRDKWLKPQGCGDEHCHLMVQCMESWLIVDRNALATFYGQRFRANALPQSKNLEEIDKEDIATALENATRHTGKGPYHKLRHGPDLLARVNAALLCDDAVAPHCNRLFTILSQKMGEQA